MKKAKNTFLAGLFAQIILQPKTKNPLDDAAKSKYLGTVRAHKSPPRLRVQTEINGLYQLH